MRRIETILKEIVEARMTGDGVTRTQGLQSAMMASALMAALQWWLDRHMRLDRDEALAIVQAALAGFVR